MAIRITRAGVGLTIGIILLGLVVLGGLYFVKQRGEVARRDQALEIAQQNLESQSQNGANTLSPDENNSSSTDENSSNGSSNGSSSTNSDDQASTNTPTPNSELPQTGPSDVAPVLILGLLTFMSVSFLASRRVLAEAR